MAITSVGTPTAATGTASPVTASYGTGQNRSAGNVLVAVVTWTSATSTTATTLSGGSGWVNLIEIASAGTLARTSIWWKTATGGDAAPSFSSTLGGTNTSSCTIFELSGANGYFIDTSGTVAASTTLTTQTATTSGNVTTTGEFGIAGFARERASTASVVTASGTYALATSNTGVTSTGHFATMTLSSPGTGATSAATVNYSLSGTTAQGAGAVVVFGVGLAGPAFVPLNQPTGLRAIWLRTGNALASLLSRPAAPAPPATGPPVYPQVQPARSRIKPPPRGTRHARPGAPVNNPTTGPPFRLPATAVRARQPLPPRGRTIGNTGAPVQNPVSPPPAAPPFRQPARARIPQNAPRGRTATNPGAPLGNPTAGPAFRQATQARPRIPQVFSKGRSTGSRGAPLGNPTAGPAFYPLRAPARARRPLPAPGRAAAMGALQATAPPAPGPAPLYPLPGPVRARIPQNAPRGRTTTTRATLVRNPSPGPVFRQATQPALARFPAPHPRAGRAYGAAGAPVIHAGPPFRQATAPAQARRPLPARGRVAGNPGAPVQNPRAVTLLPALTSPVRAKTQPLARGHAGAMALLPPALGPQAGPPFTLPSAPVKGRRPLPPRGRVSGNKGAPVNNPVLNAGPPFYPFRQPARTRIPQNAPRGHVTSAPGAPLRNPGAGPAFHLPTIPAKARQPLPSRGRVTGNPGAPVRNPAPPAPAARPLTTPVRAPVPRTFARGHAGSMALLQIPVNPPGPPAPVYPLTTPVKARQPLPPRGRTAGTVNPSVPPPPRVLAQQPLSQPAGVRAIFLRTGTGHGSAGAPVQNPVPHASQFYPLNKALHAQPAVFRKGRITNSPGAPVANATHGTPFPQLRQPSRSRIPQNAPRGRTGGDLGKFFPFVPPPFMPPGVWNVAPAGPTAVTWTVTPEGATAGVWSAEGVGPNQAEVTPSYA